MVCLKLNIIAYVSFKTSPSDSKFFSSNHKLHKWNSVNVYLFSPFSNCSFSKRIFNLKLTNQATNEPTNDRTNERTKKQLTIFESKRPNIEIQNVILYSLEVNHSHVCVLLWIIMVCSFIRVCRLSVCSASIFNFNGKCCVVAISCVWAHSTFV